MADTFEQFVSKERERLSEARKLALVRQQDVTKELQGIERELAAINAYATVKDGKDIVEAPTRRGRRTGAKKGANRGRRGAVQGDVLAYIKGQRKGIAPKDLIARMGATDKSAQQSVRNALVALKKKKAVSVNKEGLYMAA